MRRPESPRGRRTPISGVHHTPVHLTRWRSSSTVSSSPSPYSPAPRRSLFKMIAGSFIGCFRPPDANTIRSVVMSDDSGISSAMSDADSVRRRRGSGTSRGIYRRSIDSTEKGDPGCLNLTMEEVYVATGNFSPTMKIGQGGFGTVYKGCLGDGRLVAFKRAKKAMDNKYLGVEFQSEIRILTQVDHRNLVKFYGFLEHDEEKILVVEYVPNGTLREHLDCTRGKVLDLAARLDIAIDVAHALAYLHMYAGMLLLLATIPAIYVILFSSKWDYCVNVFCGTNSDTDHPIIHRDIKSSNILLTENLRAKVADFGFSREGADASLGITHVTTQVKGTAGYIDPEYLKTNHLTDKSDVYSFGALLVELLTGRRPIELRYEGKERVTTRWAARKFTEGDAISTMDPSLERTDANYLALEKMFELAFRCLNPNRPSRPSMRRCAEILWAIRKDYNEMSASGSS